ncbi:uncharacterized protein [Antedon mediterranea]|uniref:uncharacterized protein n=1 Tax=Antedon mediterranea TaxID=105859 RepID=UPI003AF7FD32
MASTLRCMSLWLLLLLIIGVLSPLAAETSNKISRVKRKTCENCSTANFESEAVTVCHELDSQECCRVCEKGQYRIDNACQYNNDTRELQFNCERCGTGTYQDGFNVKSKCDQCPLPSVSCQQGEVLSEDCNKYSGEYKCHRPKINTSTTEPPYYTESVITSENPHTGTDNSTNSDDNNNIGKIVGSVAGGLCFVILVIVIVAYVLYKKVNSTYEPKPYLRVSCNQLNRSDENGFIETAIPDDSSNYVLKDGKEYFEFESDLANVLPPNGSKLEDFFHHLMPDCNITNIIHDHKGDVCEGKRQLLKSWTQKVGETDNIRVQLLLSGMRKVDGLQECRRQIIEKCCCLNSETNTNM